MTTISTFEVRKDNLSSHRMVNRDAVLSDGQVLAKVERFALTANNVTYAVVGDRIDTGPSSPERKTAGV